MKGIEKIKDKLNEKNQDFLIESGKRISIQLEVKELRDLIRSILNEKSRLITISVMDKGLDLELYYHLDIKGFILSLILEIPKEENQVPTITDIVPGAQWAEREAFDLFGIKFKGNSKLEKLIISEKWMDEKPPLRRDHRSKLPSKLCKVAESLITTGLTAEIPSRVQKNREKSGLRSNPPATISDEKALKEIQILMRKTSFSSKVGYDWNKKELRSKHGGGGI